MAAYVRIVKGMDHYKEPNWFPITFNLNAVVALGVIYGDT